MFIGTLFSSNLRILRKKGHLRKKVRQGTQKLENIVKDR